jgi:Xaa-Pro dipeptidase
MKEGITEKVNAGIAEVGYDALLVFGYDNIQYLSGAHMHFPPTFPDRYMALFWPKEAAATCIIPHEWESSFLNLGWVNKTRTYNEKPGSPSGIVEAAVNLATNTVRKTGKIGLDVNRVPLNVYNRLKEALEEFEIVPCDDLLRDLRITKTKDELALLDEVVSKNDQGLAGHAHHILVLQASGEMNITEGIRTHAMERMLDEVGHHAIAQAVTEKNMKKWWPNAPMYGIGYDSVPKQHEWLRMELWATINGYWSKGARLLSMDDPVDTQKADFEKLITLRKTAQENIKPGVKASDVYKAVKAAAQEKGIALEPKVILGSGIGVSTYEPPYISEADETVLEQGMIIVLTPAIRDAKNNLLISYDSFLITEDGNKILGWWKDWREPFIANYTY